MLDVTFTAWAVTIGVIVTLLALDLFQAIRNPHAVGFREATLQSIFYIAVAVTFGVVFGLIAGWDFGAEYFAGYIVEKSLSVDNLFVFVIIMTTFAVPAEYQQKVLIFGIITALVMRVIFILLGATLISLFSFMFLLFGLLLLFTAVQLFRHRDEDPDVEDNAVVRVARKALPFTDQYEGQKLVTRIDGRRVLTPLFLVLIAIGGTDILFALDSIPAVFGITQETYIVLTANAFALLGLRALYFLVSGLLDRLVYLSIGLSLILGFIGIKLILEFLHTNVSEQFPEVSTMLSLIVIVSILTVTTVASLVKARRDPTVRAHAGSLRATRAAGPHRSEEPQEQG
ncbi:MAG: TerC family protein [Actinomycetota bacterium]|nr:TerC family protein [Actinomycetota bacterium]